MKNFLFLISSTLFLSSCQKNNDSTDRQKQINEAVKIALDSVNSIKKIDTANSIVIEKGNTSTKIVTDVNSIKKNDAANLVTEKKNTSDGEEWLRSIFKSKTSDKYFPDYNVEDKLCTKRFQEFISESGEIYGPSNLDEKEYEVAERRYKDKWSKIYPIEENNEMWLFGRGNGGGSKLKDLKISKISDLKYDIYIDYGNDIKTQNVVTLVKKNGSYKIDYCKTKYID